MDAHVLISHNVDLGEHSMIIGQSAIAGSTKTGHHFTAAGQSGVVGHLRIGNNVTLGARGVITKDTPDNVAFWFRAVPHMKWKRNLIIQTASTPDKYNVPLAHTFLKFPFSPILPFPWFPQFQKALFIIAKR